ncbi:MAG: sulfatase [Actinomycetota bacterium]
MTRRARLTATLLVATVTASSMGATQAAPPTPSARVSGQPSIVLIVTDDQRWDTLWAMPRVQELLVDQGLTFQNSFVVNPVCCPSRTSMLTGQYSHSSGVYSNEFPYGIEAFDPDETIATWLRADGYDTALIGKYLNRYAGRRIPPGWSHWAVQWDGKDVEYYDYTMNIDGKIVRYGSDPADYSTRAWSRLSTDFIRDTAGPLFLMFAPKAPHDPGTPAPTDKRAFKGLGTWRPASYNELDVSDKPAWVQQLPVLDAEASRVIDRFRKSQYRSLLAVDRAVADIVDALQDTGRLGNTMIVFTSDNGMLWGEHRWRGKLAPYEESIRVPLVVRYDPLTSVPGTDTHLVANIDLTPTFAELAGVPTMGVDGASLVPLLSPPAGGWRTDFLIEHINHVVPTYCAVRNEGFLYVDYDNGDEEFYDLAADPLQMDNIVTDPGYAATLSAMQARLAQLCVPPPPGSSLP